MVDATIEFLQDFIGKIVLPQMKKDTSDENLNTYAEIITKVTEFCGKQMEGHGKKFLCGDKISIADFSLASIFFSFVYNDALNCGPIFYERARAIVSSNSKMTTWVLTMQTELADYLKNRPVCPF